MLSSPARVSVIFRILRTSLPDLPLYGWMARVAENLGAARGIETYVALGLRLYGKAGGSSFARVPVRSIRWLLELPSSMGEEEAFPECGRDLPEGALE